MKVIGILLGSLSGAGAEKSLLTLATALADRGHQVHLLLLRGVYDYTPPSTLIVHLLQGESPAQALRAYTQAIAFDLFVCSRVEFYHAVVCTNTWGFVCITPSAWITTPRWRFIKRHKAFRKLHKYHDKNLIAVSKGVARDLIDTIGVASNRVRVMYNAYDFKEITKLGGEPPPASLPPNYLLCVGALKPRKGQAVLLRALAQLADKQVHLVLLGKGEDEKRLQRLARALGVEKRVHFMGWCANPYAYIAGARLCVLASTAEGLPRVVVESLVLKVPVVSTNCPSGPNELLIGSLAPFLVPVNDAAALAQAITKALDYYPPIDDAITAQFAASSAAKAYEALASDVVSKKSL